MLLLDARKRAGLHSASLERGGLAGVAGPSAPAIVRRLVTRSESYALLQDETSFLDSLERTHAADLSGARAELVERGLRLFAQVTSP